MKIAYADPPYPGLAHYYKDDPNAAEVNLPLLIAHLEEFDGWALSTNSPGLRQVIPVIPEDARIGAWVKPFASFKPGVNPAYAWEPIIFKPARKRSRGADTVRDWVSCNITLKRGLVGAKPAEVCYWIFNILGARRDDEFVDVFPGTGGVMVAWKTWRERQSLFMTEALEEVEKVTPEQ